MYRGGTNLHRYRSFKYFFIMTRTRACPPQSLSLLLALSTSNHIDFSITMSSAEILELLRIDSIDRNATADNLPGPGRNIGRLYDWLGARLERVLSNRKLKLGHNPDAVAHDIRQVCRHDERLVVERHKFPGLGLTKFEKKNLKNLCKKLIACARFVS